MSLTHGISLPNWVCQLLGQAGSCPRRVAALLQLENATTGDTREPCVCRTGWFSLFGLHTCPKGGHPPF